MPDHAPPDSTTHSRREWPGDLPLAQIQLRRVLTLPGEMDVDDRGQVVAVGIYRNPKDLVVTTAVERAVGLLNTVNGGPKFGLVHPPKGWIR